jgi:hypothetical protein
MDRTCVTRRTRASPDQRDTAHAASRRRYAPVRCVKGQSHQWLRRTPNGALRRYRARTKQGPQPPSAVAHSRYRPRSRQWADGQRTAPGWASGGAWHVPVRASHIGERAGGSAPVMGWEELE